jgi:alkylation response protein AidB-like acyl-CoA dehydrogenase
MKLTAEQKLVEDMVKKFAKTELQPIASDLDKAEVFPREIIKKLSQLGFMGMMVPEEYDGSCLDVVSYCVIIEEISKALGSVGFVLIPHNGLVVHSILKHGSEDQKKKWLPPLARGDMIGAFCLAEEQTGSDPSKIKTQAEKAEGAYVISGAKYFVTNAEVADLFVVIANVDGSPCAFLVEKGIAGLKIGEKEELLGMRASGVRSVELEGVRVNAEDMLGQQGHGTKIAVDALDFANLGMAALAVGIGQSSLEDSLKYSKERRQFDRPICEFQLVQEMLVGMEVGITQARLLVQDAAAKYDADEDSSMAVALAKLCATDAAMEAATKAIQVHGGYGYTKDYPVERYFRDAKVSQVWGGTSLAQKSRIADLLLQ